MNGLDVNTALTISVFIILTIWGFFLTWLYKKFETVKKEKLNHTNLLLSRIIKDWSKVKISYNELDLMVSHTYETENMKLFKWTKQHFSKAYTKIWSSWIKFNELMDERNKSLNEKKLIIYQIIRGEVQKEFHDIKEETYSSKEFNCFYIDKFFERVWSVSTDYVDNNRNDFYTQFSSSYNNREWFWIFREGGQEIMKYQKKGFPYESDKKLFENVFNNVLNDDRLLREFKEVYDLSNNMVDEYNTFKKLIDDCITLIDNNEILKGKCEGCK